MLTVTVFNSSLHVYSLYINFSYYVLVSIKTLLLDVTMTGYMRYMHEACAATGQRNNSFGEFVHCIVNCCVLL